MPIKWSALKVSEAMDMVEEQVKQIMEPLESAKLIIQEAEKIPNLPQYITQELSSLSGEISSITGYTLTWGNHKFQPGSIQRVIERVRRDLPKEAMEMEQAKLKAGSQSSLI